MAFDLPVVPAVCAALGGWKCENPDLQGQLHLLNFLYHSLIVTGVQSTGEGA